MNQENKEKEKGRIVVWLEPEDIKFLANEWRKIPDNTDDVTKETWVRIAFRLMTSLHKSGIDYEPTFPKENAKYQLL